MGDPGAGPDQDLSIEKQFENFLNDFLRGVNTQIKDYKKQRKILAEAIRPVNLRSPTYVEENYTLVQQTAPELRSKMEVLMQTFSRAKEDIESLLSSQPPETRNAILKEWQKMEEKQVSAYISFFMIEEDLIVTHEQLMSFYDQTSATFSVDVSSGEIVFENVEDEVRNRAFLMTIDRLLELQQEAVKNQ
ncbi:MAG: hypothetical protein DHS20C02_07540 [Micavibrio sp.]|nr:MAG: hypothetical protein DHS20C02_07540 [Micavibrio sp.]